VPPPVLLGIVRRAVCGRGGARHDFDPKAPLGSGITIKSGQ
jgi:hypothetical protein